MKRALLVGIDEYSAFPSLAGCVNDVVAIEPLLGRNDDGSPNFGCQTRTKPFDDITRDSLLVDLDQLLAAGVDVALLYFAGHGAEHGDDVSLCTVDGTPQTPGVKLSEVLAKVQASAVREVIIILDCCFSGAAGGVPQLGSESALIRPGVSILAASRGDQTAAESADGRGVFSTYLGGALNGGAADVLGKVTLAGVYSYLSESFGPWEQRPTFKANVDRLNELRRCSPSVPLGELRRLAEFFPDADFEFGLDPSYEPDAEPEHPEHEAIFAILQRCRAAKLVEPIDTEHMYYAAVEGRSCVLTPLGKHYWRLASQGLL